jgi:hypothetical protein
MPLALQDFAMHFTVPPCNHYCIAYDSSINIDDKLSIWVGYLIEFYFAVSTDKIVYFRRLFELLFCKNQPWLFELTLRNQPKKIERKKLNNSAGKSIVGRNSNRLFSEQST